jgi:hypothetical protein
MMSMILVVGNLTKFYKFMPRQNNISENNCVKLSSPTPLAP